MYDEKSIMFHVTEEYHISLSYRGRRCRDGKLAKTLEQGIAASALVVNDNIVMCIYIISIRPAHC